MEPKIDRYYEVKDVAGIQAVGKCIGRSPYQGDRSVTIWEFEVRLPHPEDPGRGIIMQVRETDIFAEVVDA